MMSKNINKQSLFITLSLSIFFSIVVIMSLYSIYNYNDTRNNLLEDIKDDSMLSLTQLEKTLPHYIQSYAVNEYEKLIFNQMGQKDILAIIVKDYNLGKITGQQYALIGKIRVSDTSVLEFDNTDKSQQKLLQNSILVNKKEMKNESGQKLAELEVYASDVYLKKELAKFVKTSIIEIVVLSLILIIILFIVIQTSILKPVYKIIYAIQNSDKYGIPNNKVPLGGSRELISLSNSINHMISSIEESKQKLKNQKEEFESIFNYSKDGIAILDLESNFLKFNDAYLKMTGFKKEELEKESCLSLTASEDKQRTLDALDYVIENGSIENFEKSCIVKDEKRISVNISVSLLPDKQRLLMVTKDTSSLKLLQEQARLASMGEMIGNIAHQWRQPLSVITTSVSGFKLQTELEGFSQEKLNECTNNVILQANYLSQTIDSFRDFIKGDKIYKKISIKKTIDNALSLVDASLHNNFIKLILDLEDDIEIHGNIHELSEGFINIINNSKDVLKTNVKNEEDRLLFIKTKKIDNNSLEVSILDSGGGIDDSIISRVFEPYFTTKHKSQGTGLGLAMTNKIVRERHKGIIEVHNEEFEYDEKPYKGACFTLTFKVNNS